MTQNTPRAGPDARPRACLGSLLSTAVNGVMAEVPQLLRPQPLARWEDYVRMRLHRAFSVRCCRGRAGLWAPALFRTWAWFARGAVGRSAGPAMGRMGLGRAAGPGDRAGIGMRARAQWRHTDIRLRDGCACVLWQAVGTTAATAAQDCRVMLLRVSYVTTMIMRDLTSRGVPSFGKRAWACRAEPGTGTGRRGRAAEWNPRDPSPCPP